MLRNVITVAILLIIFWIAYQYYRYKQETEIYPNDLDLLSKITMLEMTLSGLPCNKDRIENLQYLLELYEERNKRPLLSDLSQSPLSQMNLHAKLGYIYDLEGDLELSKFHYENAMKMKDTVFSMEEVETFLLDSVNGCYIESELSNM